MAIKLSDYRPLTFKEKEVEFNLYDIDIKKPTIYCSDPWGVIRGYINGELDKLSKQSPKKARLQDSLYYAKQAEQFFTASKHVPLLNNILPL